MLTTCPECHTAFRIAQEQLDRRRGLVRCGRCSAVFNAYDALLPELRVPAAPPQEADATAMASHSALASPPPVASLPEGELNRPAPSLTAPPSAEAHIARPLAEAAPVEPAMPRDSAIAAAADTGRALPADGDARPAAQASTAALAQDHEILFSALPSQPPPRPWGGWHDWTWGLASLLLAMLLVLQLGYFFRVELAGAWPASRPYIRLACRHLGCVLPLPQDLAALRIDASALESDPENPARTVLHVSMSNRSARTVAWPHLILILTDLRDAPIAQRPFAPREYLPEGRDPATGLGSGQEQEIRLELELVGLSAYGYRLDKLYP